MAKGFPDFFGESIFPVYGSVEREYVADRHSATGATDTLLTITGKGLIRGVNLYCYNVTQDDTLLVNFKLDTDNTGAFDLFAHDVSNVHNEALDDFYMKVEVSMWWKSRIVATGKVEVPFIDSAEFQLYAAYAAGTCDYQLTVVYSLYA